jgi:hypothetical protein
MACTDGITHPANYRVFFSDEEILIEPTTNENCTFGEPDVSVTFEQFAFRKIRFILVCEDRARRLQLI